MGVRKKQTAVGSPQSAEETGTRRPQVVRLICQAQAEQKRDIVEFVEEKFERRLSKEISLMEVRLSEELIRLEIKTSADKAELIRWMFFFWVGQVAVILGILFAFFKR